ncbi:MAG: cytochrome c oxidase assembly protein [Burkholderiales bacterium]
MTPFGASLAAANRQLVRKLLVTALVMFGFAFAMVPFYEQICEATGIRDLFKPEAVEANTQIDASREISVEFDSNTQRLPWTFKPLQRSISVHPGEVTQVLYEVRNTLDRPVTGQAVPSYGPQQAALYFRKMECFCFRKQTLGAGEVRKMPVVFVIDPKLPRDVNTVTLSYTFFEVNGADGGKG